MEELFAGARGSFAAAPSILQASYSWGCPAIRSLKSTKYVQKLGLEWQLDGPHA